MNEAELLKNIDQLNSLLSTSQEIGIVIGRTQNIDKMGAALSLYLSLTDSSRNVQIVSSQEPIVELSNLVGVDKIGKQFSGLTKGITVSVPYNEGEVEKVSYSTEGDRMNFNILAGESGLKPFTMQDIQLIARGATPDLVIAIGVDDENEIKGFVEEGSATKIVNIDNSAQNPKYGDVVITDASYSSISEIITVLLQELALPVQIDIAQNLLDGVMSATHNFTLPQTSSYAFEAAAVLMRQGAQRVSQITNGEARPIFQPQAQQNPRMPKQQNPQNQNRGQVFQQPRGQVSQQAAQTQPSQPVQNQQIPQPQFNSMGIENKESKPMSNEDFGEPQDIPSDWFVPKVFKGSKKPGQE